MRTPSWYLSSMFLLTPWMLAACGDASADDDAGTGAGAGVGAGAATGGSGGSGAAAAGGSTTGGEGGAGAGAGGGSGGVGGGPPGNGSCTYPGVPHPMDDLPGGIMPTLPSPDAQPGFPYDPCGLASPSPMGAPNEFVVATDGDDATAGNDGNGTLAAPRRTVPVGSFGAGTRIFIYGSNSPYGTVDFNMGDESDMEFDCDAADPCWIVGIDRPRLGRRINFSNTTHLLIDGISVVDIPGGGRPWGNLRFSDSQYLTLRNSEVRGDGSSSSGGSVISLANVEFMVTFQTQIHSAGSWESNPQDVDVHGWRPSYGNRYLWLLDSELYHLQADGVQTGNSNNQNPQSESSHYIYIAGNLFYENYENAVDNKNSYHVILSSNDVRDFYAAQGASGSNGTAIILSNNSEGPWTGYHWAINNRIWNTSLAIRDSGSEANEKNYIIGNTVWNANTAFIQANNGQNRELWIVNNTASGTMTGFDMGQPGINATLQIAGNIFYNAGEIDNMSQPTSTLVDNVLFNTSDGGQWDVEAGNLTSDPLLESPSTGDMGLAAGSPALGATTESPVYAEFQSLYGMDIRVDQNGTPRPQGGWDIGAIQTP